MMGLNRLEGKKIYVQLNSGRIYTGVVLEIVSMGRIEDVEISLITIKDKFGSMVSFSNKEIKFLEEEKEDGRR